MLKTTIPPERLTPKRLRVGDNKVNRFGVGGNKEIARKLEKLFKSQKSAKLRKKLLKNRNSPNFGASKAKLKFLTSDASIAFNRLWLAFIKAPIL